MYGSTTTDLSLNTPARCLTSVPNDTRHHRFLVAPCALPSSVGDDQDGGNGDGDGDGNGDPLSMMTTTTNMNMNRSTTNPLYLLRYHEDMNELAIDASLTFPTSADNGSGGSRSSSSGGEIWNCSSCPSDKALVVTNRESASASEGGAETVLWRIPSESFREDEYDPYYQGEEEEDPYQSAMYGKGRSSSSLEQTQPILEEVVNLTKLQAENDAAYASSTSISTSTSTRNSWTGRISDMQWNPDSFPELNDSITSHTSNPGSGATFITVEQGTHRITTWDLNTACPIRIDDLVSLPYPSVGGATCRRRGRLDTLTVHPKLSWDPHNTNTCAVTQGSHVHFMDLRSSSSSSLHSMGGLKGCHALGVTHVDHNPNKPHVICTSGQDGFVKFWDVRYASSSLYEDHHDEMGGGSGGGDGSGSNCGATSTWRRQEPLKILRGGHSHWTTTVKYNPNHDQLLLSGGTDGMVNLWRISSISSAPLLDLGDAAAAQDGNGSGVGGGGVGGRGGGLPHAFSDIHVSFDSDDNDLSAGHRRPSSIMTPTAASADETSVNTDGGNAPDVRVNKMEMSEAVYDVAWSSADPWIYLSLGYDGTVVLNHVPSEEKYKILL